MKSKLSKRFLSAVIASACIVGSVALPSTAASAGGITTEVSKTYYELDPVVTYDGLPQIDTQFNAYQAVKLRQDATTYKSKAVFKDSNWSYETKTLAADTTTGYNLPTDANWTQPILKYYLGSGNDNAVNSTFPSMFRAFADKATYGYGIATYDNKLVTTCIPSMGKTSGNVASTVTWTASQNGTVRLYDPDGGTIGRLPKSTGIKQALTDKEDKIGIAIYKNNKQIWPAADSKDGTVENIGGISYYTLLGETWDGVTLTDPGRVSVDFPKIDGLNVVVGDKIRIMIVPLIKVFNKMINALSEKIADMIYSKSGVMLTDEGETGTTAAGTVNGTAVLYATATSQKTPDCNKAGTVFYNSGDGYYYFFTTANKATFKINNGAYGENKAERYNEKTNEWKTPENIHLNDGRLEVYSSYVYRIKIG